MDDLEFELHAREGMQRDSGTEGDVY